MTEEARDLYSELGARPVINALGPRTFLGGSIPHPDVTAAMELAGRYYVDMEELLRGSGRVVADLIDAEAALITPGCAAAMYLGTAACITGADADKMARLPDTAGLKNKVIIQRAQRYRDAARTQFYTYARVVRQPGTTFVEPGSATGTSADEFAAALDEQTAMVLYPAIDIDVDILSLPEIIEIAHARDIPVFVDAAFHVYPLDGFRKYTAMGADLVGYGAKYFGAPNSSGVLCGRADLVEAALLHSFACFETRHLQGIGRPLKIDRQEVAGVVAALRRWLEMDHDARIQGDVARAAALRGHLGEIPFVTVSDAHSSTLTLTLDEEALGKTAAEIDEILRGGDPSVWLDPGTGVLRFHMHTVHDGDEEMLAKRIRDALTDG